MSAPETNSESLPADLHALMQAVDEEVAHMWMVRTFLKHSDEAREDEELAEVHRELYDFMLALGPALAANDAADYLRIARKKFPKARQAAELFVEIQPDVSGHMNFQMAARSLTKCIASLGRLLGK